MYQTGPVGESAALRALYGAARDKFAERRQLRPRVGTTASFDSSGTSTSTASKASSLARKFLDEVRGALDLYVEGPRGEGEELFEWIGEWWRAREQQKKERKREKLKRSISSPTNFSTEGKSPEGFSLRDAGMGDMVETPRSGEERSGPATAPWWRPGTAPRVPNASDVYSPRGMPTSPADSTVVAPAPRRGWKIRVPDNESVDDDSEDETSAKECEDEEDERRITRLADFMRTPQPGKSNPPVLPRLRLGSRTRWLDSDASFRYAGNEIIIGFVDENQRHDGSPPASFRADNETGGPPMRPPRDFSSPFRHTGSTLAGGADDRTSSMDAVRRHSNLWSAQHTSGTTFGEDITQSDSVSRSSSLRSSDLGYGSNLRDEIRKGKQKTTAEPSAEEDGQAGSEGEYIPPRRHWVRRLDPAAQQIWSRRKKDDGKEETKDVKEKKGSGNSDQSVEEFYEEIYKEYKKAEKRRMQRLEAAGFF